MGFGSAWAAAPSCGSCIASRARSSYLSHPSPVLQEQRVQCLPCVCALGWCCGIAAVLVWFEARLGQAARSWWNLNSSSSLLSRTLRLVARCLEATAQSKGALAGGGCSLGCSGALGSDVFMWAWEDFPEGPPAARVFLEAAGSGVLRNCVELDVGWEGGGGTHCLWTALPGRQKQCVLLWVFGFSRVTALGDFPLLLTSIFPQINWYFLKLASWTVSDLGLLLGTG